MPDRTGSGRARWTPVAAGPLLLILAALPQGTFVLPRLILAAFLVFIAPGLALSFAIGGARVKRERAVEAFVLSLAVIGAIGFVGRLLGIRPVPALAALAILTSGLGIFAALKRPAANSVPGGRLFATGLVLLALVVAIVMAFEGGTFGVFHDSIDHIATVREILESGDLFPATAFYPPLPGDHSIDPRKGFFHLGLAFLSLASSADPAAVWRWIPVLTASMAVLAFGALARRLLANDAAALLAAALFALFHGGPGKQWMQVTPYGTNLAQVAFWMGAVVIFDAFRGAPRAAARLALTAFAAVSVHITAVVLLLTALAATGLGALLVRGFRAPLFRKSLTLALLTVAGALPLLVFRIAYGYPATNPIHTHLQGVATVGGHLTIVRPDLVEQVLGWLGVLAVPLSLFWVKRMRRDDAALYIVWAAWLPVLLVLDPWAMAVIGGVLGYLAIRLVTVIPDAVVIAGSVAWGYAGLRSRRAGRIAASIAVLFAIAVAARFDFRAVRIAQTPLYEERNVPSAKPWESELRKLDREIPKPEVILSDPVTSYCIPAFSHHRVVSALNQHTSPGDARAIERARDLETMLDPYVPWSERLPLFAKHNVRYVLLNETFRTPLHHFYCDISPALAPVVRRSFLEARSPAGRPRFETVSDEAGFLLLRAADLTPDGTGGAPENPFLTPSLPEDAVLIDADMEGSVRLVAVRIGAGEAEAGGDFPMECWFTRTDGPLAPFPYEVYVRCETDYPKGPLYRPAWAKLYRRFEQARTGRLYRFRAQHAPCEGVFPPPDWPRGALVADRFTVDVAGAASAGDYTIRVIVRAPPLLENYSLKDFFSESDYFEGVAAGRITIVRRGAQ